MKRILFFLFSIFISVVGNAQTLPEDTVKKAVKVPPVIHYIHSDALQKDTLNFASLDTTLDGIEVVNNVVGKFYSDLGTIGSASQPQIFSTDKNIFTDAGFHTFDLYVKKSKDIRYYKTNTRFSEIKYHGASGKEQQINVMLTENITPNWNAGIDFYRLGALGFMKNAKTYNNSIDVYTWFHTKNNRYNLFAHALWNTIKNEVNGGARSDSTFESAPIANRDQSGFPVFLDNGLQQFRSHEFGATQSYDFGSKKENKLNDSVSTFTFNSLLRVKHSINFESDAYHYSDAVIDSGLYENFWHHLATRDSLHYFDLRNKFSLMTVGKSKSDSSASKYLVGELGFEHQFFRYYQLIIDSIGDRNYFIRDSVIRNMAVNAVFRSREDANSFSWRLDGTYDFSGAAKENYTASAELRTPAYPFGSMQLLITSTKKSPSLISEIYYSNHFIWENDFEKTDANSITFKYELAKYKLSVGATSYSLNNYMFFYNNALPVQAGNAVTINNYFLQKDFRLGKFQLKNYFLSQQVVDGSTLIHLPSFISSNSLYFQTYMFKKALLAQFGFDLHYNTSYYADAYMPATSVFYWQEEKKTGGYALVDFFFNFKIKSARIFLKVHNLGDDVIAKGYYLTPHYSQPGRVLQFGLSWRFFD